MGLVGHLGVSLHLASTFSIDEAEAVVVFAISSLEELVEVAVRHQPQLHERLRVALEAGSLKNVAHDAVDVEPHAEVDPVGVGSDHVGDGEVVGLLELEALEVHVHDDAP